MLARLPNEIIHLIFQKLDSYRDRLSLAALCQSFHDVLLWTPFPLVRLRSHQECTEIEEVSQLLYTVVRSPEIASLVRELDVGMCLTFVTQTCEFHGHPYAFVFDRDLLEKLVHEATSDKDRQEKWLRDLERGATDPWLALLIPKLTHLRKISFVWLSESNHYVSTLLTEAAKAEKPVFPYLEETWHWDAENGIEAGVIPSFFKFPAMRKLGGFTLDLQLESNESGDDIPMGSSSITDIDLVLCHGHFGSTSWIRACKALETFRLEVDALISTDWGSNYRDLCQHRRALKAIDLSEDDRGMEDPGERNVFMGSFADFTSLKILRVPCTGLVQLDDQKQPLGRFFNLLPSSLEILSICNPGWPSLEWTANQCESLLNTDAFPNLKTICIESFNSTVAGTPLHCKIIELKRRCADNNITLRGFDVTPQEHARYWNSIWPFDHDF